MMTYHVSDALNPARPHLRNHPGRPGWSSATLLITTIAVCIFSGAAPAQTGKPDAGAQPEKRYSIPAFAGSSPAVKPAATEMPLSEKRVKPTGLIEIVPYAEARLPLSRQELNLKYGKISSTQYDVTIYTGASDQYAPQVAIDGNEVYAVDESDDPQSGTKPYGTVDVYHSIDGGSTWSYMRSVYHPSYHLSSPQIVLASGCVVVSFQYGGELGIARWRRSDLDFTTSSLPAPTATSSEAVVAHRITTDAEQYPGSAWFYMAYLYKLADGSLQVLFSKSKDTTRTWESYQKMGVAAENFNTPCVGLDYGKSGLYLAYLAIGADLGRIIMRKSIDLGSTWTNEQLVPIDADYISKTKIGPFVAASGQQVAVMYQCDWNTTAVNRKTGGDYDLRASVSRDGGMYWSDRTVANSAADEILPWISHDADDNMYVSYFVNGKVYVTSAGTEMMFGEPDSAAASAVDDNHFSAITASTTSTVNWAIASWAQMQNGLDVFGARFPLKIPPIGPSDLVVTPVSSTEIDLTWTDNSSDETNFGVYMKAATEASYHRVTLTPPNTTSYRVTGLAAGTEYSFFIRAINANGFSLGSGILTGTTGGGGTSFTATTTPASSITTSSALLNSIINPNGMVTTAYFEWSTDYALGTVSSTPVQTVGSGTGEQVFSANLTGLNPGSLYYYRIVAQNSSGTKKGAIESLMTLSESSTAPTVTTEAATSLTSLSATLKGTVNPNGSSTTAFFEWGTSNTLGVYSATPSQSVGSGTSTAPIVADLTGLSPSTVYYYRVAADNSGGRSYGAIWSFSTTAAALTPDQVTLVSPVSGATDQSLYPELHWNAASGATRYHLQVSTTLGFSTMVVDDATFTGTWTEIGPLTGNTSYYWRVSGINASGEGPFSTSGSFTTIPPFPTSMQASTVFNFPAQTKPSDCSPTDYKLIGFPGAAGQVASTVLGGQPHVDWELYWDNSDANVASCFVQYDGSSSFVLNAGRGYWAIAKSDITINTSVTPPPRNAHFEVEIPLVQNAWNLITNPFESVIPWSRIQSANNITTSIYTLSQGVFNSAVLFRPYFGYYFFNGLPNTILTTLRIPYYSLYADMSPAPEPVPLDWSVNIELSTAQVVDGSTQFGISRKAKPQLDAYDGRKPRALASLPEVYFDRKEWDSDYPAFVSDIRPPGNDVEQWTFTVKSTPREQASIRFKGVGGIPAAFDIYLIDKAQATYVDLRKDSIYRFVPVLPQTDYTVVVGDKKSALQKANEIVPTDFMLGQNFPNPFNPTTSFMIRLPRTSDLSVTIYNVLGQPVRSIFTGSLGAGQHWFTWDGKNSFFRVMPSGVYYCRMDVAGARSMVNKMILMK